MSREGKELAAAGTLTIGAFLYQRWWIPRSLPSLGQSYILGAVTGAAIVFFLLAAVDFIATKHHKRKAAQALAEQSGKGTDT